MPWFSFRRRSRILRPCRDAVGGCRGLEIGGPSRIFSRKGRLPLYPVVASLDGLDFRADTTWRPERGVVEGYRYAPDRPPGILLLGEATELAPPVERPFEFILASHTLEHVANPLKALAAWRLALAQTGVLVLVLPHPDGSFDHRRDVTPLAHLIEDFERDTTEDDLTHLPEVLARHDLTRDPRIPDRATFEQRSRDNHRLRCLHHHVFDTDLVLRMLDHAGFLIRAVDLARPYHIMVLAEVAPGETGTQNEGFLDSSAGCRVRSPFPRDRQPADPLGA